MGKIIYNSSTPSKMYWGASEINAAYYGENKIYPFEGGNENEVEYDFSATFNITETGATKVIGQIYSLSNMYVDDVEITPSKEYTFSTIGEHIVKYKIDSSYNVLPSYLFKDCNSLIKCDFTHLDINILNSGITGLVGWFMNCTSLKEIVGWENWDISNVESMQELFSHCHSLTDLTSMSNWNTSSVTSLTYAFLECSSLTDASPIKNWDLSNALYLRSMFAYCTSLMNVTMNNSFNTDAEVEGMFNEITTNGTFYYNSANDYSKIISLLPSTWSAVPIT